MDSSINATILFVRHNIRIILEICMSGLLLYVFFRKPKKTPIEKLTSEEIEELVRDWKPEPLHNELSDRQVLDGKYMPIVEGQTPSTVTVAGKELANFASCNPLGFVGDKKIELAAEKTLRKYGCGSCGPRGFYGSIDVHIRLEEALASFMGVEQAILYSSAFATIASAIPTFAKRSDIIFCDEGVNHSMQVGVSLSRSTVHYFRHNDGDHLAELLETHKPKKKNQKRFVVVEGLYYNYGDIVPLKQIMELKKKHCFYLILDESYSFGVLGEKGKGVTEHLNLNIHDVDIHTASLSNTLGSVGGFCCGSTTVVSHQRLNGSGYVFSASLPPYLSVSAHVALDELQTKEGANRLAQLRKNIKETRRILCKQNFWRVEGDENSNVIHIRFKEKPKNEKDYLRQSEVLQKVVNELIKNGLMITRAKYVEAEKFLPSPSIRVCVSSAFDVKEIQSSMELFVTLAKPIFS